MTLAWLQLIGGLAMLLIGGEFLVRSAVKLAIYIGVSSMVVALTVVSFGTSFPELVVSINAALKGHPDISVGNVVGSNIANLALVLGMTTLIFPLAVKRSTVVVDWPVMLLTTGLLVLFAFDLEIAFWEGLILVVLLVGYNFLMIRSSRKQTKAERDEEIDENLKRSTADMIRTILLMIASMVILIVGAEILVNGAVQIATHFGVEQRIIAVSIIAFGTSAPELATSLVALYKKETAISVGNLIGSNIFNILGILGITSLLGAIPVNESIRNVDFIWMAIIPVALFPILLTRLRVARVEGGLLLATYIAYLVYIF